MNIYLFTFDTNYGESFVLVNAPNLTEAKILACKAGAWSVGNVTVITANKYPGILAKGEGLGNDNHPVKTEAL